MREEEIIKTLREEAEQNIPDVRERVYAAAESGNFSAPEGDVLVKTKTRGLLWAALALLVLLIVAAMVGVLLMRGGDAGSGAFKLVVSINPSVEFTLSDGKTVSSTRSLNRDAAVLLQGEDFTGSSAEEAALRFAELADSKHLIGADGIRLYAEGQDGGTLASVRSSLTRRYAQYAVTDMDDASFDSLIASYDENEMGDFENWLKTEMDGRKAQFRGEIEPLLDYETYQNDLKTLDRQAFNQKYEKLGDDVIFEDGDETEEELLEEFRELLDDWQRKPDRVVSELFREYIDIDEIEDRYTHRDDDDDRDRFDDDDDEEDDGDDEEDDDRFDRDDDDD